MKSFAPLSSMMHLKKTGGVLWLLGLLCALSLPFAAKADCCVCTHPEVNGEFCLSFPAGYDCSLLKNNSDANLKASTCTGVATCSKTSGGASGKCVNDPVEADKFNFASLPKKSGTGSGKTATSTPQEAAPTLNIPIPGLTLDAPYVEQDVIYTPFLAQYISAVQKYLIGISIIVAAMMLVYGGILYIISGTGAKVQDAKTLIQDALIGLVLILGAYVVLVNINPNMTTLSALKLPVIRKESFDFSTGYGPESGDAAMNVDCETGCPDMKHPEGKGSGSRMKAACKGGGTKEALKAVLTVWAKEARPYGSAYIRGGSGYGKEIKLASPYTGYLFCHLGEKGWITDETVIACGLPEGFHYIKGQHCTNGETVRLTHSEIKDAKPMVESATKNNKGQCYAALKKDYMKFFVCPMKCNDLFGADCSGFVGLALGCAGIKHDASTVYKVQAQARAEANYKGGGLTAAAPHVTICTLNKKIMSINSEECSPANPARKDECVCEPTKGYSAFALTKEAFLANVLPSLPFGSTIEYMCPGAPIPHMFMYSGKMGLPFETIESGGPQGDPNQGTATFLNWQGLNEFTVGGGIEVKPSMAAYVSGMCGKGQIKYIYAMSDL